jgi:hypothetical protein
MFKERNVTWRYGWIQPAKCRSQCHAVVNMDFSGRFTAQCWLCCCVKAVRFATARSLVRCLKTKGTVHSPRGRRGEWRYAETKLHQYKDNLVNAVGGNYSYVLRESYETTAHNLKAERLVTKLKGGGTYTYHRA